MTTTARSQETEKLPPFLRGAALRQLRAQVAAVLRQTPAGVVATGWPRVDDKLPDGGLARGAVHEWFGTAECALERCPTGNRANRSAWRPPLTLLMHLARQAAAATGPLVWIGPAVWPYPVALHGSGLLERSVFIRARSVAERLAAAVPVLRGRAVTAVVLDGSGLDLTATRRLQLAAEGGAALCLAARPPHEVEGLSASRTRWLVRTAPTTGAAQRWIVELLRCKGLQPIYSEAHPLWRLERNHATRDVVMAADVGDGCCTTPPCAVERSAG